MAKRDASNHKTKIVMSYLLIYMALLAYILYILSIDSTRISEGYKITMLLPAAFVFCYVIFLQEPLFKARTPFIVLFVGIAFFRYVIL